MTRSLQGIQSVALPFGVIVETFYLIGLAHVAICKRK